MGLLGLILLVVLVILLWPFIKAYALLILIVAVIVWLINGNTGRRL